MSIFSLILAVLMLASCVVTSKSKIKLKVNKISEFPFSANKLFTIEITTTDPNGQLSSSIHDTMVIAIVSQDGRPVEKAILNYGFKDMIDQEHRGELMRIPIWQKTPDSHALIAQIAFTRLANNHSLEIYQLVAESSSERRDKLTELPRIDRIYQRDIELLVPPKLELAIEASDGRKNEFVLDKHGVAYCRAYDGVPRARPVFLNADEFQVEDSAFNERDNRIVLRLRVSRRDHLKTLRCRAGSSEESVKIIVLHHPNQVILEPEIAQGATIENGSWVACTSVDGHPTPVMRWVFVSGPPNAWRFFNISPDGRMLHLRSRTPLGSQWAFNCTATNWLPSSRRIFNRTVEFSVGRGVNRTERSSSPNDDVMAIIKKMLRTQSLVIDILGLMINSTGTLGDTILRQKAEIGIMKAEVAMAISLLKHFTHAEDMQKINFLWMKRYMDGKMALRRTYGGQPSMETPHEEIRFTETPQGHHSQQQQQQQHQQRNRTSPKRYTMMPIDWTTDDIFVLRIFRMFARSKMFYVKHSKLGLGLELDFSGYWHLRLSLMLHPFLLIGSVKPVNGSFTVTIADSENRFSNRTEEKPFQIGIKPIQLDILFLYTDLIKLGVFQSDRITVLVTGSWDM